MAEAAAAVVARVVDGPAPTATDTVAPVAPVRTAATQPAAPAPQGARPTPPAVAGHDEASADAPPLPSEQAEAAAPVPKRPVRRPGTRRVSRPVKPVSPMAAPRVDIPFVIPGEEHLAREELREQGQHLARQDRWDRLSDRLLDLDRRRVLTPGLVSAAALLAEGARLDVLNAAREGIARNAPKTVHDAVADLEQTRAEFPESPGLAAVLALTHVDVAQLWRGNAALSALATMRRTWHDRNMSKAARLVDQFDPFECDSPLWAAIRCAVLEADPMPGARVADDYEDLIDLDPGNPGHMMALGRDLHPHRFGSWEALDLNARRTAARTGDLWGLGAYAWIWIGAMQTRSGAQRRLDVDLFAAGLHDILDRHGDQHMVNVLAALTGLVLPPARIVDAREKSVGDNFGWIAQNHLREIHPLVWAETALPGQPTSGRMLPEELVSCGKARALSTLADQFEAQMGRSGYLVVGETGLQVA
ncbi:hypothetical protein [Cognatishimia sp. F0-27]|uniref:hypothetical protein n=1 Tax=Cognatishimia sp. F0-27 TaxID=2816855 RepID=UPI001D0CBEDC|nr:hypothetical protein [Cognatishimia sp. F0-27]